MLEQKFAEVYTKFSCTSIWRRLSASRGGSQPDHGGDLCHGDHPGAGGTYGKRVCLLMKISSPNAAYKVNSLIKKGYVVKVRSESDKREYHLRPTQKYLDYYNISNDYIQTVMGRVVRRFSPAECAQLEEILTVLSRELMPEVQLPGAPADRE